MASGAVHFIVTLVCGWLLSGSSDGGRLDIGLCGDWNVECNCGTQYKINIPIKQCTRFYRWKPQCKPCDDFNRDAMCSKYVNCLECSRDSCTRCPANRYGQWCAGVCNCQNGGTCDANGVCSCPSGFTGPLCQGIKCNVPEAMPNSDIATTTNEVGSSAIYSCRPGHAMPPNANNVRTCTIEGRWSGHAPVCEKRCPPLNLAGTMTSDPDLSNQAWFIRSTTFRCPPPQVISGPIVINCLSNGEWDNPPPRCVNPCPTPSPLANGHAFYHGLHLVEGEIVRYVCARDYELLGQKQATCVNGNWSHAPPKCEKILYCSDPGVAEYGERVVERGLSGDMSVGTKLKYSCTKGSILIGPSEVTCLPNATWSNDRPYCIFVSDQEMTCETRGSDVVAANHAPLRINCPNGCLAANPPIWGTVIYKKESRVCASAIHAGMIPAEGGSVLVVNNGMYNQFVPSNSNSIKTKRHRGAAESYRFNYVDDDEETKCPRGWTAVDDRCVLYVNKSTPWNAAASICKNLDSKLVEVADEDENNSIVSEIERKLTAVVRGRVWTGNVNFKRLATVDNATASNATVAVRKATVGGGGGGNATERNLTQSDGAVDEISVTKRVLDSDVTQCGALDIEAGDLTKEDCQKKLNFLCATQARLIETEVSVCEDPSPVAHSVIEVENQLDSTFNEGVVIKYRCQPNFYMSGPANITCTENSTWSSEPPKCIKAASCPDPPPVTNGFWDVIPEPKSRVRGNSAVRNLTATEKHLSESERAVLAKNQHKLNTRIQFECESRYYKLIGSSTRTCTANNQWSGRQPSCQPICGTSSAPRSPFVVGGQPTVAGQWPWQVGIARREEATESSPEWYLICGAALLTESWVVTAAHCVTHSGTSVIVEPTELRLYFGKYYRNDSRDDAEVQTREVDSIQVHHNFNPVIYDGDIALINLKSPVKLASRVQPVCLPDPYSGMSDRHLKPGSVGTVTGWGRDNNSNAESYPELLMQAEVKMVSSEECELGYQLADVPLSVTGNMFCAGNNNAGGKTDSCSGDSGGPLVVSEGSGVSERWYLEGIVSWGSPRGCGMDREYGGYTKVSNYIDWIQQFI